MRYFSWLEKTVGAQLSGDQVGKPVFVRAHLELTATTEATLKKSGKVVSTARRVVSKDGKTLTLTITGTNAKGQKVKNIAVYEKQ